MNRIRSAAIGGLVICIVGIALSLNASNLATHWQMIGANAWGGETDPGTANLYQIFGLITLGFGLFVLGSTFWRWLTETKRSSASGSQAEGLRRNLRCNRL